MVIGWDIGNHSLLRMNPPEEWVGVKANAMNKATFRGQFLRILRDHEGQSIASLVSKPFPLRDPKKDNRNWSYWLTWAYKRANIFRTERVPPKGDQLVAHYIEAGYSMEEAKRLADLF